MDKPHDEDTKSQYEALPDDDGHSIGEMLRKQQEDTKNTILTTKLIDETTDSELRDMVYLKLLEKLKLDETVESYRRFQELPAAPRNLMTALFINGDIGNGGFSQLYFNLEQELVMAGPDAYRELGAGRMAEIIERANAAYVDWQKRFALCDDDTLDAVLEEYEEDPFFEEMDSIYSNLEEELGFDELVTRYIRENKESIAEACKGGK